MKLINSELLQKNDGKHRGKYLVTLEVTDNDIDKLEDLATCYCTIEPLPECELKPKYQRWLKNTFHQFWKLWNKYDKNYSEVRCKEVDK